MNTASRGLPQRPVVWALAGLTALAACAPKLDWREVRPAGAGVLALFPCKPKVHSRAAAPGGSGQQAAMGLAVCEAGAMSFALGWAEVPAPEQLASSLREMRESVQARLQATVGPLQPLHVPGMTPNAEARQQSLQMPPRDGQARHGRVAVFAHGLRVYQLVLLDARSEAQAAQAWESFQGALKVEP